MIEIISTTPALFPIPHVATIEELKKLLGLPILRHALLKGVTASYARRLAKDAGQTYRIRDRDGALEIDRLESERGHMNLDKLDAAISFHATCIQELLRTRPRHVKYLQERLKVIDLMPEEPVKRGSRLAPADEPLDFPPVPAPAPPKLKRHNQPLSPFDALE